MLDLFEAQSRGGILRTTDVGLRYGVPNTTVLRHLDEMEAKNWIERNSDPSDRRVTNVQVVPRMFGRINAVFHPVMFT